MGFFCSVSKERLLTPRGAEEAVFLLHIVVQLKLFSYFPSQQEVESKKSGIKEKEEKVRRQK